MRQTSIGTDQPRPTSSVDAGSSVASATATNTTSSRRGLGGPSKPLTATEFLTPSATLDWSTIVTVDLPNLASPPVPTGNSNATRARMVRRGLRVEERSEVQNRAGATAVDWRRYYGLNWLTSVQDQGRCGSCWTFAAVALAETQARIEHGVWNKRSEADLHDQMGWKYVPSFNTVNVN